MKVNEITNDLITEMLVYDPIHQLKTDERDREKDATVFVNVRGCHAKHLIQVFHVTLRIGWRRAWWTISTSTWWTSWTSRARPGWWMIRVGAWRWAMAHWGSHGHHRRG